MMLGERRLNVCILEADLNPRARERLQAQVQTALQRLPTWLYDLLTRRLEELGRFSLPLIVEPQTPAEPVTRSLSLGQIAGAPAARLLPAVRGDRVEWGQDLSYLAAKAVAYMACPPADSRPFWSDWATAVAKDGIREKASEKEAAWATESDRGLFLEMLAAYALKREHGRWRGFPRVTSFLEQWRTASA